MVKYPHQRNGRELLTVDIAYRPAREEDLNEIMALIRAAIDDMERRGIHQWCEYYPTRDDFLQDVADGTLRIGIVGERIALIYALNHDCDDDYAACAWAQPERPWLVLHRLCVHPEFQGKGLAGQALHHIFEEARDSGVRSLRLDVFSQNPAALHLYTKAGFAPIGHADWRMGRFIIMEKLLEEESV